MASIKRHICVLLLLVFLYGIVIVPLTDYMRNKPFAEKLGALPSVQTLRFMSADQKLTLGSALLMRVIIYFGGLSEMAKNRITVPPDYLAMSRTIHAAAKLDPYNIDAYYFAQAFLTWDVRQFEVANNLLREGMHYRTWDWQLPFFIGFNYGYFLKDYVNAAKYYRIAADLSGDPLYASLAGRFMQQSGRIDLAIAYLEIMLKNAKSDVAKRSFALRLDAFKRVKVIEEGRDAFKVNHGRLPQSLHELVDKGILTVIPSDPYGGRFFLLPDGSVTSTSKFAPKTVDRHSPKE